MNTQHTPGPWKLFQVGDAIEHLCPATQDGASILTVTQEGNSVFAAVFNDADARLIAAAPDLLDVTKGFRRKLETYVSVYPGDKELRRLLTDCDAAIAKTEAA